MNGSPLNVLGDTKYGWVAIVQLAKDDNAQTDATKSQAVSNAGTISFSDILTCESC
jgi:hypothetical protein